MKYVWRTVTTLALFIACVVLALLAAAAVIEVLELML